MRDYNPNMPGSGSTLATPTAPEAPPLGVGECVACGGTGRMGPYFPGGLSTQCGNCASPPPPASDPAVEQSADNVVAAVEKFLARFGDFRGYADYVQTGTTGWNRLRSTIWLAVRHEALAALSPQRSAGLDAETIEARAKVVERQIPPAAGGAFSHTNSMRVVLYDALAAIRALS